MRIFILLITGLFGLIPFKAQQKMPSLIPFPQKIEKSEGYFTWKNKTLTYNAEPGQKWSNAERMLSKSLSGGKIMKKGNAKEANLLLRVNPDLAPEAYSLVVTSKKLNYQLLLKPALYMVCKHYNSYTFCQRTLQIPESLFYLFRISLLIHGVA